MKRIFFMCCTAAMLIAFSSCSDKVDPRDTFIGAYTYKATGNMEFSFGTFKLPIPLDNEGTFVIAKSGEKDQVVITGYNDSIHATVSGNQLVLESNIFTETYEEAEVQMTFSYGKATLANDTLRWDTDVLGVALYNGYSLTGKGNISMVAHKDTPAQSEEGEKKQ
jgi:hypothetical protein